MAEEYVDPRDSWEPPTVQDLLDWLEADTETLVNRYKLRNMNAARTTQLNLNHQGLARKVRARWGDTLDKIVTVEEHGTVASRKHPGEMAIMQESFDNFYMIPVDVLPPDLANEILR